MILPRLARLILRLGGWTAVGGPPDIRKAVFIGAHHTSNWDGFWALVYMVAFDFQVRFFIKDSMFWFPLGTILRRLGGVPLDRSRASRAVEEAAALFDGADTYYFGLAPEGTRSLTPGWKSGFYRIAERANVPVVFGFFCYRTRRLGIGPMITLTGDVEADMAIIRSFYETVEGRYPEQVSPIRFTRTPNRAN
ncbi:MAG: 1-acyl-sn-glycerol-3-phosphate acyltransferase [Woeseiaceae bacterium]|nr:1-acyl-sn-glycerol-3-phosphate acyltransferase [Woeseiaceae bacterium]